MKNTINISLALLAVSLLATSCIKETFPQGASATSQQVDNAPNAYRNYIEAITSSLVGQFTAYGNEDTDPRDFGYPSFFLQRDVMGQDIVIEDSSSEWYNSWYQVSGLGENTRVAQFPWCYYYKWIKNCNIVIGKISPDDETYKAGVGIAHAMRAMFYMELACMYFDKNAPERGTVPIVTEATTDKELVNNPRAPKDDMWAFILDDLDLAETYLADYVRTDIYTPDVTVVYGLKARAYLTMEDYPNAAKYARMAIDGAEYSAMTESQYLDRMTAFNTPNDAWMFGCKFKDSDPNITLNDSDSNWGSQMFLEVEGGLYGSAYGAPKHIDAHLYSTIPATDFRKKCYIDPSLDEMSDGDRTAALAAYTDFPDFIDQAVDGSASLVYGYLALKFRAGGGLEGRTNPYKATVVSVPMMRVEEMMLIEAEAVGMQAGKEAQGIALLTNFALTRNPGFVYDVAESFRNNVWWQRRVELWGEGFATLDIKRLGKGIVRSYAGTNHPANYRFNTADVPQWMNLVIVRTASAYNTAIVNNPNPEQPSGDSPEYTF